MAYKLTQGEQNLLLLQKSLPENEKLYLWSYSMLGELFATTSPDKELLGDAFRILGGLDKALHYAHSPTKDRPLLIGSSIGMQWAVTLEAERNRELIFVIGPVFYQSPFAAELREGLRSYTQTAANAIWASRMVEALPGLPVMSYAIFTRYVTMIHNALGSEQLGVDALTADIGETQSYPVTPLADHDRSRVYLAERAMLQMVRNGDICYQHVLQSSINLSSGVPTHGQDPLRQAKLSIQVFTTLVSRAAMEGGLSPEIAYSLGDSYLQAVEDCKDSGELSALAGAMYHDFVYRVHHLRTNPNYSPAILKCCDYIELSLDRKIKTSELAALVGYTPYYLTEKFKKETGQSISSYILFAKVERARVLLTSTDMTIQALSDALAFTTPNYFIQCFKKTTGYTPAQYRNHFAGEGYWTSV